MAWSRAILAMGLVAALLLLPPAAASSSIISMPTGTGTDDHHTSPPAAVFIADGLAADYHEDSCPDLRKMVRSSVEEALREDITIAAGLLLFFHDCFPQGCDASILLVGTQFSEMEMMPNIFLQQSALQLIEDIPIKVYSSCGPIVSCADIMALATHDAVVVSRGKPYDVPVGHLDGFEPAPYNAVMELPLPFFNIDHLIASFSSRGLDKKDLVALSGAHAIGRARCGSFGHRFPNDEYQDFVDRMRINCTSGVRLQDLDVATPNEFNNKYYGNRVKGEGVLYSDMQLLVNHGQILLFWLSRQRSARNKPSAKV